MNFYQRVAGLSLRDGVSSSDIQMELRVAPLVLGVESVGVVRASDQDSTGMPHLIGVPVMPPRRRWKALLVRISERKWMDG